MSTFLFLVEDRKLEVLLKFIQTRAVANLIRMGFLLRYFRLELSMLSLSIVYLHCFTSQAKIFSSVISISLLFRSHFVVE